MALTISHYRDSRVEVFVEKVGPVTVSVLYPDGNAEAWWQVRRTPGEDIIRTSQKVAESKIDQWWDNIASSVRVTMQPPGLPREERSVVNMAVETETLMETEEEDDAPTTYRRCPLTLYCTTWNHFQVGWQFPDGNVRLTRGWLTPECAKQEARAMIDEYLGPERPWEQDCPTYYQVEVAVPKKPLRPGGKFDLECREVIEALGLPWHVGDAFAYLWRSGKKPGAETVSDLKKAITHLTHEVERLEKEAR